MKAENSLIVLGEGKKMVSFVLRTMSLAKNCPYSLTCFTDFCHRLERAGTMLPCFNMKRWKISSGLYLNSMFVFLSPSLPLYLTSFLPLFLIEEEEDEHDILTNHTHGRYTRSLGRFPRLFVSLPLCILCLFLSPVSSICISHHILCYSY